MNIKAKAILVSICLLNFVSYWPAFASQEVRKHPRIVPGSAIYNSCLLKIKTRDEAVFTAFEKAEKGTDRFLELLSNVCGGSEHSALWVTNCQNAVASAKKEDWLEARNQLSIAIGLERDLPDWLLMKAVADHKTGALNSTIADLEYLCQLRKEKSNGNQTLWELETGQKGEYWYSSKVFNSL